MIENRLRYFKSEGRFQSPLEVNCLETTHDTRIVIITIIQHDLSNNRKQIEINWSNEIFNYIIENLKEIKAVEKIILDVSQQDILKIWSVVKKEDKKISNLIYKKEAEIIEYLANFNYDIDFHVVTNDMVKDLIDENVKIVKC